MTQADLTRAPLGARKAGILLALLVLAAGPAAAATPADSLIDNFDNDGSFDAEAGGRDGQWSVVTRTAGSVGTLSIAYDATGNTRLAVDFGSFTTNDGVKICHLHEPGKKTDFTLVRALIFDLSKTDLTFAISLTDRSGNESNWLSAPGAFSHTGTFFRVDLAALNWDRCDPQAVDSIQIYPWAFTGGQPLSFTLDDFQTEELPLPAAPDGLIDNFDNDSSAAASPWQREAKWWKSVEGIYTFSVEAGVGGNTTPCLHVRYDKPWTERWSFIAAGDLIYPGRCRAFAGAKAVTVRVYGDVALQMKFQDNSYYDYGAVPPGPAPIRESSDVQPLNPAPGPGWRTLVFPLEQFNWLNCDPNRVLTVMLFPQPDAAAAGEFWLDDLQLAFDPIVVTPTPARPEGRATPNPFLPARGQTTSFNVGLASGYEIRIMNVRGRKVRTLRNADDWDGRDDSGTLCPGGLYLFQIDAPTGRRSGKVVLIK